jgi:hypothetical protein
MNKKDDTTYLYMEVVNLGCIDFVNPNDYGSIMAK